VNLKRQLRAIYADAAQNPQSTEAARAKQAAYDDFAHRYQQLRQTWGGFGGYDRWASQINNAFLAAWADYEDLVPAFEALFHQAGSWPAFYAQVRALSQLPKAERLQRLRQTVPEAEGHSTGDDTAAK
jgi:predicted aminopeptidase